MQYKSAEISVTSSGTVINPGFDINYWSIYPVDGDITIEAYAGGYGNTIYGYSGTPQGDDYNCTRLRIKAISGTVKVAYYLRSNI